MVWKVKKVSIDKGMAKVECEDETGAVFTKYFKNFSEQALAQKLVQTKKIGKNVFSVPNTQIDESIIGKKYNETKKKFE